MSVNLSDIQMPVTCWTNPSDADIGGQLRQVQEYADKHILRGMGVPASILNGTLDFDLTHQNCGTETRVITKRCKACGARGKCDFMRSICPRCDASALDPDTDADRERQKRLWR